MPQSIPDIIVYGVIVAGFLLFNYVLQRRANNARRQQQQEAELDPLAQAQAAAEQPQDYAWGRAPGAAPLPVEPPRVVTYDMAPAAPAGTLDVPARPNAVARSLLRSRKEVRHAIVLMTVLGPCRALEPYDNR
jgi:hypothetical protein